MTDNTDALDELVSRYLDAEATADEVARVESDPELLARADSMRAAIEAVAAPIEIPTLDLDRIRAAAIAESTTTAVVTDVMAARRRKLERRNRIMAVAAACVVLAVSVVAVQNLGGSDGDDSFDAATESTDAASDDGGDADMADEESAFDLSADDDMAEEDAAMAEAEMVEESDIAEADDMAEASAESSGAIDGGADIVGIDAMRSSVDQLPGELGEFADDAALFAAIETAYASVVAPGLAPNVVDGLCAAAADSIAAVQDDATRSVESAFAVIDGEPSVVLVAVTLDGQLDVFVHPEGACESVRTVSQELP